MSRDEQIIEIKECVDAVYGSDCAYYGVDGFEIADEIYNAGYRKASEVAREIFEEIKEKLKSVYSKWIIDNFYELDGYNIDVVHAMFQDLNFAELKKKYTEE